MIKYGLIGVKGNSKFSKRFLIYDSLYFNKYYYTFNKFNGEKFYSTFKKSIHNKTLIEEYQVIYFNRSY